MNDENEEKELQGMSPTSKLKSYKSRNMDFYSALKEVERGKKITKEEWEENGVYVYLKGEFLTLRKADGKDYNFIIRDADMLGTDWQVI